MMTITIKRVSECNLGELTELWNQGFSDYFVPIKMSVEMFTYRFAFEELSPSLSVVAYMDERPVGIVLNGIRMVNGRKVAWNGGTSVIPEYRRYGVGKALIDACLEIYREAEVELATLEAFKQNERAIALYEQKGYQVVDHLLSFELKNSIRPFQLDNSKTYQYQMGLPINVSKLSFYQFGTPWQSYWSNLRAGGESIIIMDNDQPVGYLLFKRIFDEHGQIKDLLLYQCAVDSNRTDGESIARFGLSKLVDSDHPIPRCYVPNVRATQQWFVDLLSTAGFTVAIEQVYMINEMVKTNG